VKLLHLAIALAAALATTSVLGCSLQGEGQRCSLDASGDCESGLFCKQVAPEVAVCCPAAGTSDDAYCNDQFSPTGTGGGGPGTGGGPGSGGAGGTGGGGQVGGGQGGAGGG